MSFEPIDLEAIKRAIAMGQLEVQYADKRVRYRSIAELERAAVLIENDLLKKTGVRPRRTLRLRSAGKGV